MLTWSQLIQYPTEEEQVEEGEAPDDKIIRSQARHTRPSTFIDALTRRKVGIVFEALL